MTELGPVPGRLNRSGPMNATRAGPEGSRSTSLSAGSRWRIGGPALCGRACPAGGPLATGGAPAFMWCDNSSACANGGIQWRAGGSGWALDEGNSSQWASTGWMPDVNRCYYWGGWVGSWKVDGHWWCDLTA